MLFDLEELQDWITAAVRWTSSQATSPWFYLQIGLVLVAAGLAYLVAATVRSKTNPTELAMGWPAPLRLVVRVVLAHLGIAVFALLLTIAHQIMLSVTTPGRSIVISVAASLATAWLLIRWATGILRNPLAVKLISISAWIVAALSIVGLLEPTMSALDSVAIPFGGLRITPLLVIKAIIMLAVTMWFANVMSNFIDARLSHVNELTPSIQVLISKLVRILLMAIAVVIVMSSVGINLTALSIFSGAVGVGIGFGLQKIVANFISGVILLADKSVKPGDLVTIGDMFGRISAMNTRYISVAAGDGREFLIPNEDLVTQKVVNWTYTDKNTLVEVKFATAYDANPRRVCELAVEIAAAMPRIMTNKKPSCSLNEFADYSMKFSLTFWIADPDHRGPVRGEVMLALWEAFKKEGINVPYPVRDIRVRGVLPIEATAQVTETEGKPETK